MVARSDSTRSPDPERLDAACSVVREAVDAGRLPTGVLAVANSRETVRIEAFGPVEANSIFLLASITKPIFASAMLRLVEHGRMLLNEPVVSIIPEFSGPDKAEVRLWHLLTHTSGLDEATLSRSFERPDRAAAIRESIAARLTFKPGTRYSYCNISFNVMAELIARLTGEDDVTYLRTNVLEPLGMYDTDYAPTDPARAVPVVNSPWSDADGLARWNSFATPYGGLWSTAADLLRFGRMLLRGGELDGARILAPATVRTMTALHTAGIEEWNAEGIWNAHYGLGIGKAGANTSGGPSGELRSPSGSGHDGASGTRLWIEPELDLVFVFLTNRWGGLDVPTRVRAMNAAIAAFSI